MTSLPILIVDDQWSMRQSVAAALRDMGFNEVLLTSNGLEAMHILQTQKVAAVISDWNMPGMNGLGLLNWLRCDPACADVPFLLVTAKGDRNLAEAATAAGASAHLIKPYTEQELAGAMRRMLDLEVLPKLLDGPTGRRMLGLPISEEEEEEEKPGGSTILIVDDVPLNIAVIASILKGEYQTVAASSGRDALEIARSPNPPDLVLLDVTMPGIDGYEVCRRLQQDPLTRDIPVIFLTNNDDAKDVVRGLEAGAVDYISKPANANILKARIRTHLRLKFALSDLAREYATLAAAATRRESE